MLYTTMQYILAIANENVGFELWSLKYQGKGHCLVLYEYNKIIARGRTAVINAITEIYMQYGILGGRKNEKTNSDI